jgi:GDP-L-fucose synthase
VTGPHAEHDLTDHEAVVHFFAGERPEYASFAVEKVGGILANNTRAAEFIHDNLAVQDAHNFGVKRLRSSAQACIYPRDYPPAHKGRVHAHQPPEPTNLYSPNDNYDLAGSQVLSALLRQMHEVKEA